MTDAHTNAITIPGYRIIRQLGQGGTATVYLAIQNSFGREVALKVMSPLLNQDPTFAPRFTREARIVSQMHHASIVPVFDVGEHQRHHYLSMELLPGGDLRQRIVEGKCGPAAALDICTAIGSALELAHRKGFVHRDIKPQNILFRENGTPVLTDFGIARAIDVGTSLTAAGMFVGTPNYMSPEQVKGLELDGRSDLYSLGIVFYEMLTGQVPYQADSALSIALKHLSDPLPPLPPQLAGYQPFLNRLTAKNREQRFANSAEVLRAISTLQPVPVGHASTLIREREAAPAMLPMGSSSSTPAPPFARRGWLAWSAAALAAATAVGAGVYLWQPVPRPLATTTANVSTEPTELIEPNGPASLPAQPAIIEATSVEQTPAPPVELPVQASVEESTPMAPAIVAAPVVSKQRPAIAQRTHEAAAAMRKQAQIAALLSDARTSVAAGALTTPPEANAADHYRAVLKLEPQQAEAIAGLHRISDTLVSNAERERRAGEYDAALRSLAAARSVQPDHPRIAALQTDIEERKIKLKLRAQQQLAAAGEHLAKARVYLDRTPVTLRNVAEANDHYDEAVESTATTSELDAARERILAGYATAARLELNAKEPERALKVLSYARKRNMTSASLNDIEAQIQQQMSSR